MLAHAPRVTSRALEVHAAVFGWVLEGLAEQLGWGRSGHNRREVAAALDAMRLASFRARAYHARRGDLPGAEQPHQQSRVATVG